MILSFSVFGQKMYEEQSTICPLKFILEDKELYIFYEPNDSILIIDFLEGLEEKQIAKLKGVVMMQVMVDTAGNICCVSYTNKTTISDKKLDIPNRLQNMSGWKRVMLDVENENICSLITIVFDKYDYQVKHTGYNRNRGKQLLKSSVYKRNIEKSSTKKM